MPPTVPSTAPVSVEPLEARRLFAAGNLDPSFGLNGTAYVGGFEVKGVDERNGRTVVVGRSVDPTGDPISRAGVAVLTRLTADGRRDPTFQHANYQDVIRLRDATGVIVRPDNRVVVTATLRDGRPAVAQFRADGSFDPTFGANGVRVLPLAAPSAPRLTADGRVVVGGAAAGGTNGRTRVAAVRLTAGGQLDPTFGANGLAVTDTDGAATAVAVRPDGRVVVGGYEIDQYTDRPLLITGLTAGGKQDAAFTSSPYSSAYTTKPGDHHAVGALALTPGGAIVAGVHSTGGNDAAWVLRLSAAGDFEWSAQPFVEPYGGSPVFNNVRISPDGQKIVAFGRYTPSNWLSEDAPTTDSLIARYDLDGTIDHTFGPDTPPDWAWGRGRGWIPAFGTQFGDVDAAGRIVSAGTVTGGPAQVQRRLATGADPLGVGLTRDGVLWVEGSSGNDVIRVSADPAAAGRPARVRVSARGQVRYFDRSRVTNVIVDGGAGDDTLSVDAFGLPAAIDGGAGNDALTGGAGADVLRGNAGNDWLRGQGGSDTVYGGFGDDTVDGGAGKDELYGGYLDFDYGHVNPAGRDTLTYASRTRAVTIRVDYASQSGDSATGVGGEAGEADVFGGFVTLVGGAGNDTIRVPMPVPYYADADNGYYQAYSLIGGAGDDLLVGGAGNDTLDGGAGRDRLYGGFGDDLLLGRDGFVDYLDGGKGLDRGRKDPADATYSVERLLA